MTTALDPSTAVFYANLVYSKTRLRTDAMALARAHLANADPSACLRILEQQQQKHAVVSTSAAGGGEESYPREMDPLYWQGIELACAALYRQAQWNTLLEFLDDVCRTGPITSFSSSSSATPANNILDDEDVTAWKNILQTSKPNAIHPYTSATNTATTSAIIPIGGDPDTIQTRRRDPDDLNIHPLVRICWYRGMAFYETGCGHRAARFWKLALQLDCRCVKAWNQLVETNLCTISELYHLVIHDMEFSSCAKTSTPSVSSSPPEEDDDDDELQRSQPPSTNIDRYQYLKDLYLASIELTTKSMPSSMDPVAGTTTTTTNQPLHLPPTSTKRGNETNIPTLRDLDHDDNDDDDAFLSPIPPKPTTRTKPILNLSSPPPHTQNRTPMPVKDAFTNHATKSHAEESNVQQQQQKDIDRAYTNLCQVYKLQDAPQVLALAAKRAYRRYDWHDALRHCERLAEFDPSVSFAAYVYVSVLVNLGRSQTLFRLAHEWVADAPDAAESWFAVGGYYYSIQRYHVAQRHWGRATRLDPHSAYPWIAFGCAFAAVDESDQALASFRAAQRVAPGEHASLLYMGMEYVRTNHIVLASYFLRAALESSSNCDSRDVSSPDVPATIQGGDPLCWHEFGVLQALQHEHGDAIQSFQRAIRGIAGIQEEFNSRTSQNSDDAEDQYQNLERMLDWIQDTYWEPNIFNLGQSYRKTQRLYLAELCFRRCISLCPEKCSGYSALAFTQHLMSMAVAMDAEEDFQMTSQNLLDDAISNYHLALSIKSDDPFATEMLNRALEDQLSHSRFLNGGTAATTTNRILQVLSPPLAKTETAFKPGRGGAIGAVVGGMWMTSTDVDDMDVDMSGMS
jgi:anaphase-promoting complex subunit 6